MSEAAGIDGGFSCWKLQLLYLEGVAWGFEGAFQHCIGPASFKHRQEKARAERAAEGKGCSSLIAVAF
jgi:hypothetical protein